TADSWWKTPSIRPMTVAPSSAARMRSPLFAGGRYSAGRIASVASRSRLGPRKTMIFCIVHPLAAALLVHGKDLEARHDHPDDRDTDLFPGQVYDNDPVHALLLQGRNDIFDI